VHGYGVVTVGRDVSGIITVSFQYNPLHVQKVKNIEGYKWHPDKKYWSFPDSEGILEKILKGFEGEEIHLDPALKGTVPDSRTITPHSPLKLRGEWGVRL